MLLTGLIVLGVVGAGLAGWSAPSPLPEPSPRWPLIIAYPVSILAILFLIAGVRLQYKEINTLPRQWLLDRLMELTKRGESLFYASMKEHPDLTKAWEDWGANYDHWYDDVISFIESDLTPLDVHAFRDTNGIAYGKHFNHQIHASHGKRLSEFENELDNLAGIVRRQQEAANS